MKRTRQISKALFGGILNRISLKGIDGEVVRKALLPALVLVFWFTAPAIAQTTTLYDIDFGSPPHTVGLPPATGAGRPPRDTVSTIVFGSPTVVSGFGALTDQPLEF
ncbi:MAG: hypothetical protein ACE1ZA_17490, partial [Pseudomonadales bacterium]